MSASTLTRAERQAQTRAALLSSAAELFREQGLEGTSVDQIAREAGYTKGAFYANFASKEELFLAMLDEKYAAELERLEQVLPGGGIPAEQVRAAAEDFIRFAWSDPEWPKLYFEFAAYAARNPEFREELLVRDRRIRERMAATYRRWADGLGVEPPIPVDDLAMMTFSMANGFLMTQLIEPDVGEYLYGTMMTTFFRGVAAATMGLSLPGTAEPSR
jgi:AcrR family transcriptional regulator